MRVVPPPHQHNRLVPAFLVQAQQHDPHQVADMQAVCRAVVADIADDASVAEPLVERLEIGALMDKAAIGRGRKKSGAKGRHGSIN